MGFDPENKNLVICLQKLIERSSIPKDNDPSHLPTIVDEKHEMALLDFIDPGLNEQEACDFPEDFLRDWVTYVIPSIEGENAGNTLLLPETALALHDEITEPTTVETWTLKCYALLPPFWGTSSPAQGHR